ncbi:MAG: DUF1559 domain-containing protein, partial [Gemmataceae bacterium]
GNNLRQLGLGLHLHESSHNQFPPGYIAQTPEFNGPSTGLGWGWGAIILPQIEQGPLHNRIDFQTDLQDARYGDLGEMQIGIGAEPVELLIDDNEKKGDKKIAKKVFVREVPLKLFLCPSDVPPTKVQQVQDENEWPLAAVPFANYVAHGGSYPLDEYPDVGNGPFGRNRGCRRSDIRDGLSGTIFLVERSGRKSPLTTWVGAVPGGVIPQGLNTLPPDDSAAMVLLWSGAAAEKRTPNNEAGYVADASSLHHGGVQLLMGDLRVEFIRDRIDPAIWVAWGTRSSREYTPPFD